VREPGALMEKSGELEVGSAGSGRFGARGTETLFLGPSQIEELIHTHDDASQTTLSGNYRSQAMIRVFY
jgi:hypothetical protein